MKRFNLRKLGEKLHRAFHRACYGKNPNHECFNHDYYTFALAYFDKRLDIIEKEVHDLVKQNRYLLERLRERELKQKIEGENLT